MDASGDPEPPNDSARSSSGANSSNDAQAGRRGLGWRKKENGSEDVPARGDPSKKATVDDTFSARRSNRVNFKYSQADGDTWQETLAVCEVQENKLVIRSYYTNTRTKQRAWDEPPSGASRVLSATDEMHRMANMQLLEMQIVTGHVPDSTGGMPEKPKPKKKAGGFFRRGKTKDSGTDKSVEQRKIQYKPDSFLAAGKKEKKRDESLDPQLQQAIALSMREANGEGAASLNQEEEEPVIRSEITYRDDEDALAMVMALSLSEAEAHSPSGPGAVGGISNEEELLQRAMRESKSNWVARAPTPTEDAELLGIIDSPSPSSQDRKLPARSNSTNSDDWMNQKMPAKPLDVAEKKLATEEEAMLQQALERSRRDVQGGASSNDGSLMKMSPETARKPGRMKGLARRLSSKNRVGKDTGVV